MKIRFAGKQAACVENEIKGRELENAGVVARDAHHRQEIARDRQIESPRAEIANGRHGPSSPRRISDIVNAEASAAPR